jgi:hypothetical protein
MSRVQNTREAWLSSFATSVRPWFTELGCPLPPFRVACGFPVRGGAASKHRVLGQCWDGSVSESGHVEIFISPVLDDSSEVAATLVHELAHAAVGCEHGRKAPFVRAIRPLGLVGKPTATTAGEAFKRRAEPILAKLGAYPHSKMAVMGVGRVQSTRLLKAECLACGYIVRVTAKWLEVGPPHCPDHGPMIPVFR